MRIVPTGGVLGARIEGCDLALPLTAPQVRDVLRALGRHGVLCFPGQTLAPVELADFGRHFGALEVNVANTFPAADLPEVMILSNIVADGRPIGLADAGQGWHTDLSYSSEIALATVLHAKAVPMRDGRTLGATEFRDMHAAWRDLPAEAKARLEGRRAIHDFDKFWEMMRARPGSHRKPLSEAQRRYKPPVAQPIMRIHPITGQPVLYCNAGYAVRIEDMPAAESDALLDLLFRHQAQDRYLHRHVWTAGDVLMWDDIGTIYNAVADYRPDEPRLMHRVQVMATLDYPSLCA